MLWLTVIPSSFNKAAYARDPSLKLRTAIAVLAINDFCPTRFALGGDAKSWSGVTR